MNQFEFLSTAFSIIFALSIGRQITALPFVFNRRRWDPLYIGYFVGLLFMQLQFWWRMWNFSTVDSWDFVSFLIMVAAPMSYFLAVRALVTQTMDGDTQWRTVFERNASWFFGAVCVAWALGGFGSMYVFEGASMPPPFYVTIALFLLAAIFKRRWFHWAVLAWWLFLLSFIAYGIQVGSMS